MPPRWHDAFTSNGLGITGWTIIEHLHGRDRPASVNSIASDLGVSYAAANRVMKALDEVGAVAKQGATGWTLQLTPTTAADLIADDLNAWGTRTERLGAAERARAERKRKQALWASQQKDSPEECAEEPPAT